MKRTYALAIAVFILLIIAGAFRATHHPVYGNCDTDKTGTTVCDLIKWEGNK